MASIDDRIRLEVAGLRSLAGGVSPVAVLELLVANRRVDAPRRRDVDPRAVVRVVLQWVDRGYAEIAPRLRRVVWCVLPARRRRRRSRRQRSRWDGTPGNNHHQTRSYLPRVTRPISRPLPSGGVHSYCGASKITRGEDDESSVGDRAVLAASGGEVVDRSELRRVGPAPRSRRDRAEIAPRSRRDCGVVSR